MTLQQQIQALQDEGYWVSGIIKNLDVEDRLNRSSLKRALFYALYHGPVKDR